MMASLSGLFRGWRHILVISAFSFLMGACSNSGNDGNANGAGKSPDAPTLSLSADPGLVARGKGAMLVWQSANATSCTGSGAWSGTKPVAGLVKIDGLTAATSTFTLTCTGPGGTVRQSAVVTAAAAGTLSGLDFPGSGATVKTMRFRFTDPLAIYPATYIWRCKPRQQNGYYTAFFWGNDDGLGDLRTFLWTRKGRADSYYGAHPYPRDHPYGNIHDWEIALEQDDFVNGVVVYDRWYTQALRVWADARGKHHEFYWDLPNADEGHRVVRTSPATWGNVNPPRPTLTWGDAPWNPGKEVWNGVIRGIQIYSAKLSMQDMLSEANAPRSTAAGAASIWYLNTNPTPADISDKSGAGHNPEWVGSERPLRWTGP